MQKTKGPGDYVRCGRVAQMHHEWPKYIGRVAQMVRVRH